MASTTTHEAHRTNGRALELNAPTLRPSDLLRTDPEAAAAIARLGLGLMILPHGLQKTLGWFGGAGFEGTMAFFTDTMGLPWVLGLLAIAAESLGGVALLLGLGGRVAALGVAVVMIVAAALVHLPNGFFMNWSGALPAGTEGWEFHLVAAALAGVVVLRGSGIASLDRWLTKRLAGVRLQRAS